MIQDLLANAAARRPLPQGGIIIAATPLGNPYDASLRLIDALGSADVIAAEDTRRTRALAQELGVTLTGKVVSNFDHNESHRAPQLVDAAQAGQRVLVVTDAGMPSVSDPGFPLVAAAYEAGVPVTCLPGPSAVPTALALSGLGVGHFAFFGFAPRKDGARRAYFSVMLHADFAVCFFESPHRIAKTLRVAAEVLGQDRPAAVCRELTKTFEEIKRGGLGELAAWAEQGVKGEICVVIEGVRGAGSASDVGEGAAGGVGAPVASAASVAPVDPEAAVDKVEQFVAEGMRLKEACAQVSRVTGLGKRDLYQAALARKNEL